MKNLLIIAAMVASPLPAMAQTTEPAPMAQPAPEAMPAPATPPQAAPAPTDPAAILAAEFPFYDKDKSGDLSKIEFSDWLITLKTKSAPASATPDVKADTKWASDSFVKADTDKSKTVSVAELTTHLLPAG